MLHLSVPVKCLYKRHPVNRGSIVCVLLASRTSSTHVSIGSIVCVLLASQTSSTPVSRGSIVCVLLSSHKLVQLLSLYYFTVYRLFCHSLLLCPCCPQLPHCLFLLVGSDESIADGTSISIPISGSSSIHGVD